MFKFSYKEALQFLNMLQAIQILYFTGKRCVVQIPDNYAAKDGHKKLNSRNRYSTCLKTFVFGEINFMFGKLKENRIFLQSKLTKRYKVHVQLVKRKLQYFEV